MDEDESRSDVSLDWEAHEIIKAVTREGGKATTTEIREISALESNKKIKRRGKNKLEPAGLVTLHQPQPEPGGAVMPAKEFKLTDAGQSLADRLTGESEESARPSSLKQQYQQLSSTVDRIEGQQTELKETVEEYVSEKETKPAAEKQQQQTVAQEIGGKVSSEVGHRIGKIENNIGKIEDKLSEIEEDLDTLGGYYQMLAEQAYGAWSKNQQDSQAIVNAIAYGSHKHIINSTFRDSQQLQADVKEHLPDDELVEGYDTLVENQRKKEDSEL